MIERIIRLSHDLEARAGQVLVQLESGQVHAVDAEVFEALMQKRVPARPEPEASGHKDEPANVEPEVDPLVAKVRDLLLRGKTIRETELRTRMPFWKVAEQRVYLVKEGLLGKNGKGSKRGRRKAKPTPEELAQAAARRAAVKEARRRQAQHMREVKAARQDAGLRVAAE